MNENTEVDGQRRAFGAFLRGAREHAGLSQRDVSAISFRHAGTPRERITHGRIAQLENGVGGLLGFSKMMMLSAIYRVELGEFIRHFPISRQLRSFHDYAGEDVQHA